MANLALTRTRLLTDFPIAQNVSCNDEFVIIRNPDVDDQIRLLPLATLEANLQLVANTPASNTDNGLMGNIRYDGNYLYICTSNNNWGRIAIETDWP